MTTLHVGDLVYIHGGVSDSQHGKVEQVDSTTYTRPFALVALYHADGSVAAARTLVPVERLVSFGHPELPSPVTRKVIADWIANWIDEGNKPCAT